MTQQIFTGVKEFGYRIEKYGADAAEKRTDAVMW